MSGLAFGAAVNIDAYLRHTGHLRVPSLPLLGETEKTHDAYSAHA